MKRLGKDKWIELAKKGKPSNITRKTSANINNLSNEKEWDNLEAPKRKRFLDAYKKKQIEMPIVMNRKKKLELMAGNTRLSGMLKHKGKSNVWIYET